MVSRQVDFCSTGVENYGSELEKASPLFAKEDWNFRILVARQ